MSSPPQHDAPLTGIRVLDFTQNLPGPYATMVLRSLGAEVIKIEPPRGDAARTFPRLFEVVNAGKKSIVLDLKTAEATGVLHRLITEVDVLVEGFRPGVMRRLGCDVATARSLNPRLVYCSISAWGQDGPYRDYPGHDLNIQALAGVCHLLRDEDDRPLGAALPIGDLSASMTAVSSILAALVGRARTGAGRHLDVALVDTLLSWAYVWAEGLTPSDARLSTATEAAARRLQRAGNGRSDAIGALMRGTAKRLTDPRSRKLIDTLGERFKSSRRYRGITRLRLHALPHYTLYRTRDGRYLSIGIVDEDKFWRELCEALGLAPLGAIPLLGRFVAATPLRKLIGQAIARRDLDTWLHRLDRARIPVTPVLTLEEALRDPQLLHRRAGPDAPIHAPWPLLGPLEAPSPRLGQHSEELLSTLRDSA